MAVQFIPSRAFSAQEADEAGAVFEDFTAAEALVPGDIVYINSSGRVAKAIATSATTDKAVGASTETVAALATVRVRKIGPAAFYSGLSVDNEYYLSTTVAGGIQTSIPTGSGESVVRLGIASAADTITLKIELLTRRA